MSNQDTTAAFPFDMDDGSGRVTQHGMTLRDYFAAKAMAAMMTLPVVHADWTDEMIASWAYSAADAMLTRRQNKD